MFDEKYYPNFLSGTAYLMGIKAVETLFKYALSTQIFHLEDVYITGIVASRANLRRQHHPLFSFTKFKDLCALKGMISQHYLKNSEIQNAYNFLINSPKNCEFPK